MDPAFTPSSYEKRSLSINIDNRVLKLASPIKETDTALREYVRRRNSFWPEERAGRIWRPKVLWPRKSRQRLRTWAPGDTAWPESWLLHHRLVTELLWI